MESMFPGEKTPLNVTPPRRPVERVRSEGVGGMKLPDFEFDKVKDGGLGGGKEETALPPTLQHLVYFWEELSVSVLKVSAEEAGFPLYKEVEFASVFFCF